MKTKNILFILLFFLIFKNTKGQFLLPTFSKPVKQEQFSTDNEETSPLLFNNGRGIYYNRTYVSGEGDEIEITGHDFWISTLDDEKGWKKPYRVLRDGDVPGSNIIIGTSIDGNRLYLLNIQFYGKEYEEKIIYVDKTGKNKWSEPVEIVIPDFKINEGFIHFYVTPSGNAILISMPPNPNVQEEDIFVSVKDTLTGNWSKLKNLGNTINTDRYELGSFLSEDLKTLYFSSEGHGGYGASDIFVTYRLSESWTEWTEPENIGEPVNTKDYESYFVIANNKEVYFVSDYKDIHNNIYKALGTGDVIFERDSLSGTFVYRGLPIDNFELVIEDEFGNIVDELVTDEYGNFKFAKRYKESSNYVIKPKNEEDKEKYVGSKVYLVDTEGKQKERFVYTDEGEFTNTKNIEEGTLYEGVFNYNKAPAPNTGLVVLDENKFAIDTVYTDENGEFNYRRLKSDYGGVTLVPLEINENDYLNVELILSDRKANKQFEIEPGEYKDLVTKDTPEKKPLEADTSLVFDLKPGETMKMKEVIAFFFNQYTVEGEEKDKVISIVERLKSDQLLKVKLVGHTDDKGSEKMNVKFGKLRANAVRRLMIKEGLPAERIVTTSAGESSPFMSNDTEAGRLKNRRVEIFLSK